jgi:predicted CoA-binding protein
MFDLVKHLNTNPVIALVGATNDSTKYGNVILRDLLRKGYTVRPVNPKATAVEGLPAFKDLRAAAAAGDIGLVVYVIPPKLTLQSLREALDLSLKKVWIQPGAGNEEVRSFLDANSFEYLMDACVMVESRVA